MLNQQIIRKYSGVRNNRGGGDNRGVRIIGDVWKFNIILFRWNKRGVGKYNSISWALSNGYVFKWKRNDFFAFSPPVYTKPVKMPLKTQTFANGFQSGIFWKRNFLKTQFSTENIWKRCSNNNNFRWLIGIEIQKSKLKIAFKFQPCVSYKGCSYKQTCKVNLFSFLEITHAYRISGQKPHPHRQHIPVRTRLILSTPRATISFLISRVWHPG